MLGCSMAGRARDIRMSGGRKKEKGKTGRSKRRDRKAETPGLPAGQRSSQAPAARSHGLRSTPLIEVNGWRLYTWSAFRDRWDELMKAVEELRREDPTGYKHHPRTRFLAHLRKVVLEDIPRDPGDARYRQGKTMGSDYTHWRRAKFGGRFRLFFRYHSGARMIVYVWLNDEDTLRKAGSRSDVYATFRSMLETGRPPSDWDNLVAICARWRDADG